MCSLFIGRIDNRDSKLFRLATYKSCADRVRKLGGDDGEGSGEGGGGSQGLNDPHGEGQADEVGMSHYQIQ